MNIFSNGIVLTVNENACLLYMVPDAESWVTSLIIEQGKSQQNALLKDWRPRLFADDSVTELPANPDDLATLILGRSDYKTRLQEDLLARPVVAISTHNKDTYDSVTRSGSTVTLLSSGITIADLLANCILAYIQNLDEWIYGAVLGQVNRGKKKMISKYHPIIMADASVTTMPATEDGLITRILARADYQRLGS
jgi:hypothetical protein